MARKSLASIDNRVKDAIENFQSISEIKYELAKEAYDIQDDETKRVIDRIVGTLRQYANGYINVQLSPPHGAIYPVKIDNEYLGYNLLYLAIEIAKDLAFLDIRLANFVFPPSQCVRCGSEIIPELKPPRKMAR